MVLLPRTGYRGLADGDERPKNSAVVDFEVLCFLTFAA